MILRGLPSTGCEDLRTGSPLEQPGQLRHPTFDFFGHPAIGKVQEENVPGFDAQLLASSEGLSTPSRPHLPG